MADPGYDGATWRRGTRPHPGKGVSFKFPLGRRVAGTDRFVTLHGRQFTTRQRVTVFIHVNHIDRTALNGWRDVLFVNVDHVLDAIRHFPGCGCRTLVHPDEVVVIKVTDVGRVWRVDGLVGGKERRPFPTWQFNRLAIDVGDVLNINVPSLRNRILFVNVDDVFRAFCHLTVSWVRRLIHPYEVITVKLLLFRRVVFADWDIVLHGRLLTTRQWVAVLVNVFNRNRSTLNFWRYILFVDVDDMLGAFCHLTVSWVRRLIHPYEVITVKLLLFRRVVFADWDIVLHGRLLTTRQWVAVLVNVFNRNRSTFDFWRWRNWVLFVDVNDVLRAFRYHARSWIGRLVHPDEVITFKRLLFRLVLFADWGIVLNARHIF